MAREHKQDMSSMAAPETETDDEQARMHHLVRLHQHRKKQANKSIDEPDDDDDGMLMFEVAGADIEAARARQFTRLDQADRMARLAVERFQSILRAREAKADLGYGFSSTAQRTVQGWLKKNISKAWPKILDLGSKLSVPVGLDSVPVVGSIVGGVQTGVESITKASQARAKLDAVDQLVVATRQQIERTTQLAKAMIAGAPQHIVLKIDARTDDNQPPITEADIDELIAKLDAQLKEAMYLSGTLTTVEYRGSLRDRVKLQAEINTARETHPSGDER